MLKTKEIEIEGIKYKIQEIDGETGLGLEKYKDSIGELGKHVIKASLIEPKEFELKNTPLKIATQLINEIFTLSGLDTDFPTAPEQSPEPKSGE